jgi:hypothetical protein
MGSKEYSESQAFYRDLGFVEKVLSTDMCLFTTEGLGFYLHDAFVKDWVDNTLLFLEVAAVDKFWADVVALDLTSKYRTVRLKPICDLEWGRECFIHDPSGILWHIGQFN